LQLKQHAQSLAVLIREMSVSPHRMGVIDGADANVPGFQDNEKFDWLNDLQKMYTCEDNHHNQPLTSILNLIESSPETGVVRERCPLHEIEDADKMVQT